jgi:hypothetical protein
VWKIGPRLALHESSLSLSVLFFTLHPRSAFTRQHFWWSWRASSKHLFLRYVCQQRSFHVWNMSVGFTLLPLLCSGEGVLRAVYEYTRASARVCVLLIEKLIREDISVQKLSS